MRYNGLCRDPTTALLIVSELVTNAVVHGIAPIEVMVSDEAGELRIEVSDGDSLEPRPTVPSAVDHIGGRGLRIVNKLARYWGVNLHDFGKTVWAEVRA